MQPRPCVLSAGAADAPDAVAEPAVRVGVVVVAGTRPRTCRPSEPSTSVTRATSGVGTALARGTTASTALAWASRPGGYSTAVVGVVDEVESTVLIRNPSRCSA